MSTRRKHWNRGPFTMGAQAFADRIVALGLDEAWLALEEVCDTAPAEHVIAASRALSWREMPYSEVARSAMERILVTEATR